MLLKKKDDLIDQLRDDNYIEIELDLKVVSYEKGRKNIKGSWVNFETQRVFPSFLFEYCNKEIPGIDDSEMEYEDVSIYSSELDIFVQSTWCQEIEETEEGVDEEEEKE